LDKIISFYNGKKKLETLKKHHGNKTDSHVYPPSQTQFANNGLDEED